jgi:gamma-glutamylcyclotransferase (GGCT)/AIG2-like uncharacterized protein YtfP
VERLRLFVYGTLMSGAERAALLQGLGRRPATVRGTLYDLPAGYPALVLVGSGRVHGELVDAPDVRLLGVLDTYEGVADGLYDRVAVDVTVGLRTERAWTYVLDVARARNGRIVAGGRWRAPRRREDG